MLTEAIRFLQGQAKVGRIDASDEQPVLTDGNTGFASLEKYHYGRYRERYDMRTSSIYAFIAYTNKRGKEAEAHAVITSVDPDECVAQAIFNAQTVDGPGHCDDQALCTLKPLPMWAYLMSIGGSREGHLLCEQREVIDIIRDWHDYIPDAVQLVGGFTKLTIDALSKRESTERDWGREKSALEKIDLKSDGGEVPSDINVKMAPYDGFVSRDVQIGVSAKINRSDEIVIRLRVRGYEALRLSIAEEFAAKLSAALDVAPLIGTIRPA